MKKNRAMRAASALLVAVLMTTCTISGTFAKYVTEQTGTDSARVAKWGVEITATGETFATSYDEGDVDQTVVSGTADKVVAPGTEGSLTSVTLSGTPEVDLEITYAAEVTLTDWEVTGDWDSDPLTPDSTVYYCPLEIKVGDTTYKGTDYSSAADFADIIEAAVLAKSVKVEALTNLASVDADALDITWKWAFTGNDDAKDTALGDAATLDTITLSITTTATQIGD